jgi:hypothetical protein
MLTSTGTARLPKNATLVPKHVVVGTEYEVGFMIFYVILISSLYLLYGAESFLRS